MDIQNDVKNVKKALKSKLKKHFLENKLFGFGELNTEFIDGEKMVSAFNCHQRHNCNFKLNNYKCFLA